MWGGGAEAEQRLGREGATSCSGYSQHSERPQPVEGVDGDAAQPVVAQDPAEKDTGPCWPFLSRLLTGALSTLWTSQSKRFTFPALLC